MKMIVMQFLYPPVVSPMKLKCNQSTRWTRIYYSPDIPTQDIDGDTEYEPSDIH
jgi:hypothetical protein